MFNAPLSVLMRYDGQRHRDPACKLRTAILGPVGRSWPVEGDSAIARVCRDRPPGARRATPGRCREPIAAAARAVGVRSAVGVPVVVDGALWGVVAVGTRETEPLPADFEDRLAKFTELLATAIANAEGRAELDASRARIVATADATRRRIERDLHDGAQQQLVWLALALRAAQATVPEELEQHRSELGRVVDGLTAALDDLREVALGIHPAGLSEDGLTPALKRLVARSPLRVNLDCRADGRFPEPVEVAAYYVVSESLTNAAKYADTPVVDVAVAADDGALRVRGSRRRAWWRGPGRGLGTARPERPRRGDRRDDAPDEPAGRGHARCASSCRCRPGRPPLTHGRVTRRAASSDGRAADAERDLDVAAGRPRVRAMPRVHASSDRGPARELSCGASRSSAAARPKPPLFEGPIPTRAVIRESLRSSFRPAAIRSSALWKQAA